MTLRFFAFAVVHGVGLPVAASSRGLLPVEVPLTAAPLAILGPAVAALLLSATEEGWAGVRRLVDPLLRWRVEARSELLPWSWVAAHPTVAKDEA